MKDHLCVAELLQRRRPVVCSWIALALLLVCELSESAGSQPSPRPPQLPLLERPCQLSACPELVPQPFASNLPWRFRDLLRAAGLLPRLKTELRKHGVLTVFAPSEEALVELGSLVSSLQQPENAEVAAKILLFHFVPQHISDTSFTRNVLQAPTLAGSPLVLHWRQRRMYIEDDVLSSGPAVVVTTLPKYVGVKQVCMYSINTLLLPDAIRPTICSLTPCSLTTSSLGRMRVLVDESIISPVTASAPLGEDVTIGTLALGELQYNLPDRFAPILWMLQKTGLDAELARYAGRAITILAPTRGAYKALPAGTVVTNETVRYHLLLTYITLDEFKKNHTIAPTHVVATMLRNQSVVFNATSYNVSSHVSINDALALRQVAKQSYRNGLLHLSIIGINKVLVPHPVRVPTPSLSPVPAPPIVRPPTRAPSPSPSSLPSVPPVPTPSLAPVEIVSQAPPPPSPETTDFLDALGCPSCNYSRFHNLFSLSGLRADIDAFRNPLTILAPNDAAFEGLPPEVLSRLDGVVANNTAEMVLCLLSNILPGYFTLANLSTLNLPTLPTLHGEDLDVNVTRNQGHTTLTLGGALLVKQIFSDGKASIIGTNRIAYSGIYNWNQAPAPAPVAADSQSVLVRTLADASKIDGGPKYSQLVKLLTYFEDGREMLSSIENLERPFTILAPTDDAFSAMPKVMTSYLLKDEYALGRVLRLHVIQNYYTINLMMGMAPISLSTLATNRTISVSLRKDSTNSTFIVFNDDVPAPHKPLLCNGRYCVLSIDRVLTPPDLFEPEPPAPPGGGGGQVADFYMWPVIGVTTGFFIVICCACCFFVVIRRRQQKIQFSVYRDEELESRTPQETNTNEVKRVSFVTPPQHETNRTPTTPLPRK